MRAPGDLGGDEQRLARHGVDRLAHAHLHPKPRKPAFLGFEEFITQDRHEVKAATARRETSKLSSSITTASSYSSSSISSTWGLRCS